MPSLVVYKMILYRSGWASRVLFITYSIIEGLVGPVLVHNLDHAFTGCVQNDIVSVRLGIKCVFHYMYNHRGFGPVQLHNFNHAFTGCVQRDIVSVRLGVTGVIHYIYNHRGFGWACACAQSRPCLHWLCTKGYCIGQVGHHGCYSLHIQSLRVWLGLCLGTISTMPSLVVYKGILYRSGWASRVLFITYTIIEGLVGPVLGHNLDHAFTGCVQRGIVSVRLGTTGVINYIYNH